MQKEGTVIIGTMACPICGRLAPVKKSLRGRLSLVCKWQDEGCGCQLQTLTADSSMMMLKKVIRADKAKPKETKPEGEHQEPEPPKVEAWAGGLL